MHSRCIAQAVAAMPMSCLRKVPAATVCCFMLLLRGVAVDATGDTCDGDEGCSYNGRCIRSRCVCFVGWQGADCHTLQLQPAARPSAQAYCHFNDSTWGATVLHEQGTYHMWFSEMSNNCSLHMYGSVSRVVHATASSPEGPFVRQSVALPVFAHNPQVVRANGSFLLFHIGTTVDARCVPDCRPPGAASVQPPSHCRNHGHGTSVAIAQSAWGPWKRVDYILRDYTNPSPYIFSNGSVLLAARRDGIHILRAKAWHGPYEHVAHVGKYVSDAHT
jgi:hypothetical protein